MLRSCSQREFSLFLSYIHPFVSSQAYRERKKRRERISFAVLVLYSLGISHPTQTDYVILTSHRRSAMYGKTYPHLRISHRINFVAASQHSYLFLFLFFLRAATQLLFHPCCLVIDSVMLYQVSVVSQSDGIARRFYFIGLSELSRMRPFGLGLDKL